MRFTHSRAIKEAETPGSEDSVQCGRQTLPVPSGQPKRASPRRQAPVLGQCSKGEMQENRNPNTKWLQAALRERGQGGGSPEPRASSRRICQAPSCLFPSYVTLIAAQIAGMIFSKVLMGLEAVAGGCAS